MSFVPPPHKMSLSVRKVQTVDKHYVELGETPSTIEVYVKHVDKEIEEIEIHDSTTILKLYPEPLAIIKYFLEKTHYRLPIELEEKSIDFGD